MPTQQGVGLHEESRELHKPSEDRRVSWPHSRTCNLAVKDRHFMGEHDDLDCQIGVVTALDERAAAYGQRRSGEMKGPQTIFAVLLTAEESAGRWPG